jgi:hypothetical protein
MDFSLTLAALLGGVACGAVLRRCGCLRRGDSGALLSVAARVTLPALLLHTLPPALDLALETPLLRLLPALGFAQLVALTVRGGECGASKHASAAD